MKVRSFSHIQLFATPWTAAYQAPLSMGFSRQEYWSGVSFPALPMDCRTPQIFNGSISKESACKAGDPGSIPGSGKSPGEGNGNPLQCSFLENPRDRGAWWATVCGVAQSRTRLKRLSSSSSRCVDMLLEISFSFFSILLRNCGYSHLILLLLYIQSFQVVVSCNLFTMWI